VFGWVLALIARHGLMKGGRIWFDASTMEANAALRAIVRRDTGEGYPRSSAASCENSALTAIPFR